MATARKSSADALKMALMTMVRKIKAGGEFPDVAWSVSQSYKVSQKALEKAYDDLYASNPTKKKAPVKRAGLTDKKYVNRRSQITGTTPKKRLVKRRTEHVIAGKPEGYFPNPAPKRIEFITARLKLLAKLCKLPDQDQYPKTGTLLLNKVYGGRYQITQVTGASAGESDLSGTLTISEMEEWLNGAITIADARFKRA